MSKNGAEEAADAMTLKRTNTLATEVAVVEETTATLLETPTVEAVEVEEMMTEAMVEVVVIAEDMTMVAIPAETTATPETAVTEMVVGEETIIETTEMVVGEVTAAVATEEEVTAVVATEEEVSAVVATEVEVSAVVATEAEVSVAEEVVADSKKKTMASPQVSSQFMIGK